MSQQNQNKKLPVFCYAPPTACGAPRYFGGMGLVFVAVLAVGVFIAVLAALAAGGQNTDGVYWFGSSGDGAEAVTAVPPGTEIESSVSPGWRTATLVVIGVLIVLLFCVFVFGIARYARGPQYPGGVGAPGMVPAGLIAAAPARSAAGGAARPNPVLTAKASQVTVSRTASTAAGTRLPPVGALSGRTVYYG